LELAKAHTRKDFKNLELCAIIIFRKARDVTQEKSAGVGEWGQREGGYPDDGRATWLAVQ
jgi:hypothetical protein